MQNIFSKENKLIKKIRFNNRYYVYDTFSNEIIKTDQVINSIIDRYFQLGRNKLFHNYKNKYPKSRLTKALNDIEFLFRGRFNSKTYPIKIKTPTLSHITETLKNKIDTITFFVSDLCNLNCKYCPYNSNSHIIDKKGGLMPKRIARQGVEFLKKHTRSTKSITISFSGGEPLTNFKIIEYIVALTKVFFKGRDITFNITTNAVLLTKQIIRFFIKNHFKLVISLDGPPYINDKNRITKYGKGTFKLIENKIATIRNLSEIYFRDAVTFSTVSTGSIKIDKLYDYFYKKYGKISSISSQIEYQMINEKASIEIPNKKYLSRKLLKHLLSRTQNNINDRYIAYLSFFADELKIISDRKIKKLDRYIPLNSMCIPGQKVSIAPDGKLHICYQLTHDLPIGNVYSGFNIDKAFKILDEYKEISQEDCSTCWAMRMCKLCLFHARKNKKTDIDFKRNNCKVYKTSLIESLKIAIALSLLE